MSLWLLPDLPVGDLKSTSSLHSTANTESLGSGVCVKLPSLMWRTEMAWLLCQHWGRNRGRLEKKILFPLKASFFPSGPDISCVPFHPSPACSVTDGWPVETTPRLPLLPVPCWVHSLENFGRISEGARRVNLGCPLPPHNLPVGPDDLAVSLKPKPQTQTLSARSGSHSQTSLL